MYTVENIRFEDRDNYERKPIAEDILQLIEQGSANSPLFINGVWGSGKSEFCYKLFHFLEASNEGNGSRKLKVSYINSFAGDYQSNPFMLIVQAIYNSLVSKGASPEEIQRVRGILAQGVGFAKRFFVAGFRKASLNVEIPLTGVEVEINGGDLVDNIKESIKQEKKEFEEAFFEELESFRQQSEQLMKFKNSINHALDGEKLVLIIDELDRCRPDYALELIEHVKHIFDIENLFIIFSANKKQLEAIIHKKYGYGVDSEEYLEKFYQKEIVLSSAVPATDSLNGTPGIVGHLNVFCENLKQHTRRNGEKWRISHFNDLPFVSDILGSIQTRRLEKIADELNRFSSIVDRPLSDYSQSKLPLIIFGVFLMVADRNLLFGIQNKNVQLRVIKYVNSLDIGSSAKNNLIDYLNEDFELISRVRRFSHIDQAYQDKSMLQEVVERL